MAILVALAVMSLPLAAGAAAGRLISDRYVLRAAAACAGALVISALVALSKSSVVVPPLGSDVLAAVAVGFVLGRVLVRP